MSRSHKKHAIHKQKGELHNKYNRKLRRINKQRIAQGLDPIQLDEAVNKSKIIYYKSTADRIKDVVKRIYFKTKFKRK